MIKDMSYLFGYMIIRRRNENEIIKSTVKLKINYGDITNEKKKCGI